MPNFVARFAGALEVSRGDAFGGRGQTVQYQTFAVKATGCDRQEVRLNKFSAGLSGTSFAIAPLGVDSAVASNTMLLLLADNPVDVWFNSNTPLSGVIIAALTGTFSSLLLNIGANDTYVGAMLYGGSNAAITATLPLP